MHSLLILLYVVVWRACTILRVIAPVSAVRAWCEYQLEGMTILRDAYSSLAKAAGMQNDAFEYTESIARHLGYKSGGDQLKSGLFRPFLWHIRVKGHRLGLSWRWRHGRHGRMAVTMSAIHGRMSAIHGSVDGTMAGRNV